MDEKASLRNSAACRKYYEANKDAAFRRVTMNAIRKGCVPKESTIKKYDINIFELIENYREFLASGETVNPNRDLKLQLLALWPIHFQKAPNF